MPDHSNAFAIDMLRRASERLEIIRETQPDAAGIVFAQSIAAADSIAWLIRDEFDQTATVVHSAMPGGGTAARAQIAQFRKGPGDWIVCVQMLSVGTNIPRLRVGVYLSVVTAARSVIQMVSRLLRLTDGLPQPMQDVWAFFPDDASLRHIAKAFDCRAQAREVIAYGLTRLAPKRKVRLQAACVILRHVSDSAGRFARGRVLGFGS